MKVYLLTIFSVFLFHVAIAQKSKVLAGDWVRVTATRSDGSVLPSNHPGRIFQRYHFTKDNVLVLIGGSTTPMEYKFTGNQLQIGPIQIFTVEQYSDKNIVLLNEGIRYTFMPTDSFTVSRIIKHKFEVSVADTVYSSTVGIEPIFPEGSVALMSHISKGFGASSVSFQFTYVVLKDGTIGAVDITFSTNPKLNKRLIQILGKTSGKWMPGAINGKPVNVKVEGNISLGRGN